MDLSLAFRYYCNSIRETVKMHLIYIHGREAFALPFSFMKGWEIRNTVVCHIVLDYVLVWPPLLKTSYITKLKKLKYKLHVCSLLWRRDRYRTAALQLWAKSKKTEKHKLLPSHWLGTTVLKHRHHLFMWLSESYICLLLTASIFACLWEPKMNVNVFISFW